MKTHTPVAIEEETTTYRSTSIIVGVLFVVATAFLFLGEAIYGSIVNSPDYLNNAYPDRAIVILGILVEFVVVLAMPLTAVFLFPVLRRHSEALALGYVGARFFEALLFIGIQINTLTLIDVSQDYLGTGGTDGSFFQGIGNTIQSENDWMFSIYVVIFALGAMILNSVLYRSQLVPRFISVWGFIAAVVILTGVVLSMFKPGLVSELVFATPIAVQEMVFAVWLIVKGFNAPALAREPDRTSTGSS